MHSIGQNIKSPLCPSVRLFMRACVRPTILKLSFLPHFLSLPFSFSFPLFFPLPHFPFSSLSFSIPFPFRIFLPLSPSLFSFPFSFPFSFFSLPFHLFLLLPFVLFFFFRFVKTVIISRNYQLVAHVQQIIFFALLTVLLFSSATGDADVLCPDALSNGKKPVL